MDLRKMLLGETSGKVKIEDCQLLGGYFAKFKSEKKSTNDIAGLGLRLEIRFSS